MAASNECIDQPPYPENKTAAELTQARGYTNQQATRGQRMATRGQREAKLGCNKQQATVQEKGSAQGAMAAPGSQAALYKHSRAAATALIS